ncbi:hypothetical protein EI94DRAFT_1818660 [Lactarius quietus]|nr:hypothetical protein EI94DRAFT_1818660 [Lactarius quietus]
MSGHDTTPDKTLGFGQPLSFSIHYHPAQSGCISQGSQPNLVPGSWCISASDDRELKDEGEVIEERDEEEEEEEEDNDWDELDEAFDRAANDEEITMAAGFVAL